MEAFLAAARLSKGATISCFSFLFVIPLFLQSSPAVSFTIEFICFGSEKLKANWDSVYLYSSLVLSIIFIKSLDSAVTTSEVVYCTFPLISICLRLFFRFYTVLLNASFQSPNFSKSTKPSVFTFVVLSL